MEFYKIVNREGVCLLEDEMGQKGLLLDNETLGRWAILLYQCYCQQEQLPLRFRRYLTAYYENGELEYIPLENAACLSSKPKLDGFAATWLEEEEENRVWFGADGAIENRGSSGAKVKFILELLLKAVQDNQDAINLANAKYTSDIAHN